MDTSPAMIGFVGNPAGMKPDSKDNTGNLIHGFAARALFARKLGVRTLNEEENIRSVRERCRVLGFVAATGLNVNKTPHFIDAQVNAANFVERLDLPVCVFGLGAQAPLGQSLAEAEVDPRSVRLLKVLADKSNIVAVRGEFTADLCRKLGVHNVEVIGCQSAYLAGLRNWGREIAPPSNPENLTVNLSLGLDEAKLLDLAMARGADLIGQGNPADERIALGQIDRDAFVSNTYGGTVWPMIETLFLDGRIDRGAYFDYIRKHFFKFYEFDAWTAHMARYDFCLGTRFHGNMAAFFAGVPALWLVHDSRTEELCRHLGLPSMAHADVQSVSDLRDIAALADYGTFFRTFPERLSVFRDYLDKNGVTDLLTKEFRDASAAVIGGAAQGRA